MDHKTVLFEFFIMAVFAAASVQSSSICSAGESEEEGVTKSGLQEIIDTCFSEKAWLHDHRDIPSVCAEGKINCPGIKQVFNIIPSCDYCSSLQETHRTICYLTQTNTTRCAVNNYLLRHMSCKKPNSPGHSCDQCKVQFDSTKTEMFTTNQQTQPLGPTADYTYSGSGRRGHNCDDCEPCHCPEKDAHTGVSTGLAIGLLFLGIVIGAIVTTIICFCVPSLQRRPRKMGGKDAHTINHFAMDQSPESATDETLPVQVSMTVNDRTVPTAPVGESNLARYHTLDSMTNARDSHTYLGLQSPVYNEPMGECFTYQDSKTQPIRGKNTVMSPVYQKFNDDIISGTGKTCPQNKPMKNSNTNGTANHDYSILKTENEANSSNTDRQDSERPVSDHQYFVLEKQNNQASNDQPVKTDENYHTYFVLEKPQT